MIYYKANTVAIQYNSVLQKIVSTKVSTFNLKCIPIPHNILIVFV